MNFDEKLQIATFISLLFGFALIIWEFQQSRAMTAAVLASDGAIHRAETDLNIAAFADTYARACQDPQAITLNDSIVLSQIYRAFYESRVIGVLAVVFVRSDIKCRLGDEAAPAKLSCYLTA